MITVWAIFLFPGYCVADHFPDQGYKVLLRHFFRFTAAWQEMTVLNRGIQQGFGPCACKCVAPIQEMHMKAIAADGSSSPGYVKFRMTPNIVNHNISYGSFSILSSAG